VKTAKKLRKFSSIEISTLRNRILNSFRSFTRIVRGLCKFQSIIVAEQAVSDGGHRPKLVIFYGCSCRGED